ncbi:MAG: 1-(5-phosphoribosyl)-5-((5-phosphoribosylamino)methylideneamino)imidazole-4-carboxamide isomerase [Rickettsiales bacterium]|nr:1-(5-phosphoribosyl)-5-((5-phosphoribosylamino)methylideneamino)imidazole-4-carboxamide isomerase [Rickettsiales bacterium]
MNPVPSAIKLHQKSRQLEVCFSGNTYFLPYEYLRVFSPSAEVRGHGNQELTLVGGKANVQVTDIEPVGQYAIKLSFDDGHDSGLYTWQTLFELGRDQSSNWTNYIKRLETAGLSRSPDKSVNVYTPNSN